jgi:hypothetical protein
MSTQLSQIAKAKLHRTVRFTSLAHLLTPESSRQLAHCIQRYETEVFAKVIWGAQ